MSAVITPMQREPAHVMDAVFEGRDSRDRGACQELDADTLTRCDGRMIVHYESLHGQIGFPVWTCGKCGKVVVP